MRVIKSSLNITPSRLHSCKPTDSVSETMTLRPFFNIKTVLPKIFSLKLVNNSSSHQM